jgi:hypothetical protein
MFLIDIYAYLPDRSPGEIVRKRSRAPTEPGTKIAF